MILLNFGSDMERMSFVFLKSSVFSDLCSVAYEGCSWESEASCFDDAINHVISEDLFSGNF